MKTKTILFTTMVTTIAVIAALLAYPALLASASTGTPSTQTSAASSAQTYSTGSTLLASGLQERGGGWEIATQSQANLSVGQTITITSTQGEWVVVGNQAKNGTASGTLTFSVTGKFASGYTLSLTSGSFTVNGTTYTVSSGTAQLGSCANSLLGQGTTTPTGQFLIRAHAYGNFAGSSASAQLDFTNGTTEYLVSLSGTVQG
jgi:hypothetical protein